MEMNENLVLNNNDYASNDGFEGEKGMDKGYSRKSERSNYESMTNGLVSLLFPVS